MVSKVARTCILVQTDPYEGSGISHPQAGAGPEFRKGVRQESKSREASARTPASGRTGRWRGSATRRVLASASKSSIRRFVITEKAPTRAFSWLKAATTAFTFKTLLRHYAKRALTPRSLNVKLGPQRNYHEGRAAIRHYANQPARPLLHLRRGPNFMLRDRGQRLFSIVS